MVWLDGKPTLVKTLAWPVDDPDLKRRGWNRKGWSVMDDQILFWRAFPLSENPRTVIYMANTTSARDTQADTITLERVAEVGYAAHSLVIVPAVGFVTAEWRSNFGVVFRAHSRTGEFLRERHCPAQAGYGGLSVLGPTVSLCVTSTDPILPNCKDVPFRYLHYRRLDYVAGHTPDFPNNLRAETIVTWNADSGDLRMVKIPHPSLEDITHDAQFQYISPNKIVLAGSLAFTPCGAVLCAFSADAEDEEPLMFYQGEHTDPDGISNYLGQTGTSTLGPIVVHNHDSGRRITIFKSELLLGDIPSFATSRDPPGMREVWNYPNDTRTLNFEVPFLSVAATRVLVYRQDERAERPIIFVLDFDQTLLATLLSKQPSERAEWNAQLVDSCAQVKVVTRRFNIAVDGEIWDAEYTWPQRAPPEWEAHLDTILKEDEDEDEYMDDSDSDDEVLPSGLEYDEAPEEHREPVPFGYVQTTLRLQGVIDARSLAITPHAILELPEPTKNGRVFYFD
ncbi:hypothetical protein H2248_012576 [Termitomyces sp. 'cryptogamus']|nr:hypothetical protein H2248_012576 [Termitomyces sp. 'cryptogamus']